MAVHYHVEPFESDCLRPFNNPFALESVTLQAVREIGLTPGLTGIDSTGLCKQACSAMVDPHLNLSDRNPNGNTTYAMAA